MHPNLQNAIRRASAHPVRTGFLWAAGVHMADLAFGLLRMLLLAAVLSGLAYGAWALMKRDPQPTAKPSSASAVKQPKKPDTAARDYTTVEAGAAGRNGRERLTKPESSSK